MTTSNAVTRPSRRVALEQLGEQRLELGLWHGALKRRHGLHARRLVLREDAIELRDRLLAHVFVAAHEQLPPHDGRLLLVTALGGERRREAGEVGRAPRDGGRLRVPPGGREILLLPLAEAIGEEPQIRREVPVTGVLLEAAFEGLVPRVGAAGVHEREGAEHVSSREVWAQPGHEVDHLGEGYTQYHPYHLSGRPSNTFGGINYSALKKKDGTRSFIKSRYKDGKLVLIDYKSYHPHLLSSLIDYKFQIDDAYSFLASQYFNKSLVQIDEYDINQSKKITFEMLYGKIKPQYLHIKFLGQVQDLIEELWRKFNACGFVETPVFKRKIYKSWVKDMTPNKLMNYILQSYETERNMGIIKLMMDRIRDRKTKIILYQYDSVLLDFHKDDVCIMDDIKNIMDYKNYPISISVGNEFNNMMEMPMQH